MRELDRCAELSWPHPRACSAVSAWITNRAVATLHRVQFEFRAMWAASGGGSTRG
jgi:hypothetical protein